MNANIIAITCLIIGTFTSLRLIYSDIKRNDILLFVPQMTLQSWLEIQISNENNIIDVINALTLNIFLTVLY